MGVYRDQELFGESAGGGRVIPDYRPPSVGTFAEGFKEGYALSEKRTLTWGVVLGIVTFLIGVYTGGRWF
jgi:hypothetical protein